MPKSGAPRPTPMTWEWVGPYGAWALGLAGWILYSMAGPVESLAPQLVILVQVAGVTTISAGVLGVFGFWWVAGRRRSTSGRLAVLVAGVVVLGTLTAAGWLLPPPPPSPLQTKAAQLLARRLTTEQGRFRGVPLTAHFNHLGWPDDEGRPDARQRVVFMGDSFLEVRSSRNLAARVESALGAAGLDVDVVNVAQADTGPVPEYRHWFFEQVLPQKPDQVVLFLYTMNDLVPGFRFEPYQSPRIEIGIGASQVSGLGSRLTEGLARLAEHHTVFHSRAALVRLLPGGVDGDLAYLAALAHDAAGSRRGPATTVARLAVGLLGQARHWRRLARAGTTCAGQPWQQGWAEYERIFRRPVSERLDAIGAFIAANYCEAPDATPYISALRRQPPDVRQFITSEPDMPYYLFPAVAGAAGARGPGAPTGDVDATAAAYVRLVLEMRQAAHGQGSRFAVVLIPEASMVDSEFRTFWRGLRLPMEQLTATHALHRTLASALMTAGVRTLDLAREPGLLDGGFWLMDGHFNDVGHDRVSSRLALWLQP